MGLCIMGSGLMNLAYAAINDVQDTLNHEHGTYSIGFLTQMVLFANNKQFWLATW
jgi:hypothetical protein